MYIHTYINSYKHVYLHTYVSTYVCTYMCTYIHTYIRTYIHWVKAHVGTYGNELAVQLAKPAAQNGDTSISYNKISKGTLISEIEKEKKNKMAKTVE